MSIKKKILKNKPVVKVTFKVEKEVAETADQVAVVGDFNNWNPSEHLLKPLKNGGFTTTLDLEQGREYQFRYLVDGTTWMNETEADKVAATPYMDAENSVVVL